MSNGPALAADQMPLLTVQELHAAQAPRAYRPHTITKPKPFDWNALTPTCTSCSTKTGTVNTLTGLCATCDPTRPAPAPAPAAVKTKAKKEAKPKRPRAARPTRPAPATKPRQRHRIHDVDAVIEAYTGGQTKRSIAEAIGVGEVTVRRALLKAGIELRDDRARNTGGRPARFPLDIDAVTEAYAGGQTIHDIAEALTSSYKTVRTALLATGVVLRDDRSRERSTTPCAHGNPKSTCEDCREARNSVRRTGRPRGPRPGTRSTSTQWIPIDEQAVVDTYLAGVTVSQLAADHGCTPKRIYRILNDHDVERRDDRRGHSGGRAKVYDPAMVDRVRDLYVDHGYTMAQVAAELGVSEKVIWTLIRRTPGLEPRESASDRSRRGLGHPTKLPQDRQAQVITRYLTGEPAPSIATDLGVSPTAIYAVLSKNGITERHGNRIRPSGDNARGLKDLLLEHDLDSRTVKVWALDQGLIHGISTGLPPRRVVDAYLAAHGTDQVEDDREDGAA